MARWSREYVDGLFDAADYSALVDLLGVIRGAPEFDKEDPTFGLPEPAFLLVETLLWEAQSSRSGTWTYFETTPSERQIAMRDALRRYAPAEYAEKYACGMRGWRDPSATDPVDRWIEENEDDVHRWLWELARQYRSEIDELT